MDWRGQGKESGLPCNESLPVQPFGAGGVMAEPADSKEIAAEVAADMAEELTHSRAGRAPLIWGILVFGFGMTFGVLMALSGVGLWQDSARLIISVFLAAVFVVVLIGLVVVSFRRPLSRRLFGLAEAQLEHFAAPLAKVAEGAAERNPERATSAARDLLQLALTRYAWVSTRRWIIGSLTGLIAAMAALAGAALLFTQNQLLEEQSGLLSLQNDRIAEQSALMASQTALMEDQNSRIEEQSALIEQQVQLAEAARNAEIAVETGKIAELLGQAVARRHAADLLAGVPPHEDRLAGLVPVLDPIDDLGPALLMRINATSRAARPYRYLRPDMVAGDDRDMLRVAMAARRQELPQTWDRMTAAMGWQTPPEKPELIDRPVSPERGQILEALVRSGVRELEPLNFYGLDLSFADVAGMRLLGVSAQGAELPFANFDRAQIIESDFGGASLENTRYRRARIARSRFAALTAATAKPGFETEADAYVTAMAGADFSDAVIEDVSFAGVNGGAMVFDRAILRRVDFANAEIGATRFAGAVLDNVKFSGAGLWSVEFDEALVFRGDFLEELTRSAFPRSFRADRYQLEPATIADVEAVLSAYGVLEAEDYRALGKQGVWRVRRIKPFEDQ